MSTSRTIRERLERATAFFDRREAVVLTTFNLNASFLEDQALPILFGIDAPTLPARRAELHDRLGETPCTVFYDPHAPPRISGRFRYVARPVPLRGRFFHPKITVIAGRDQDEHPWVYLAVSSANLSLSGWGRNAESFAELWIHSQRQQGWAALRDLLGWLRTHANLGEKPTRRSDALTNVRAVLDKMPEFRRLVDDGSQPWTGSIRGQLYSSVVDKEGLADFLRMGRTRRPNQLWVRSPYWADLAPRVEAFDARKTLLFPAQRADRRASSLSQDQAAELAEREDVELQHIPDELGMRFWHMKLYWIEHGKTSYLAIGSCNFTRAGLVGAAGNVEAMLVYEAEPDWLVEGKPVDRKSLASPELVEQDEGPPTPAPVALVVAYDWRSKTWRWWLDPAPQQRDFALEVPGLARFPFAARKGERAGKAPPRGAYFEVHYCNRAGDQRWRAPIVELHLDHSTRVYGRALTASEILDSWQGKTPSLGSGEVRDEDMLDEDKLGEQEQLGEAPAAFDAVNLYQLYRGVRALRAKLSSLAAFPERQHGLLVGRPGSAMALARLAERSQEAPVVRYLVLREIAGLVTNKTKLIGKTLVADVQTMAQRARTRTLAQLLLELDGDEARANAMLDWFEARLAQFDRTKP